MNNRCKFYTLGRKEGYKDVPGAGIKKDVGGWAMSFSEAVKTQKELRNKDSKLYEVTSLPFGEYDVFELPECTAEMVCGCTLLQPTLIGDRVDTETKDRIDCEMNMELEFSSVPRYILNQFCDALIKELVASIDNINFYEVRRDPKDITSAQVRVRAGVLLCTFGVKAYLIMNTDPTVIAPAVAKNIYTSIG